MRYFPKALRAIFNLDKEPRKEQTWGKHSFSQSGEDMIVRYIFDILNIANPSYIDVGAHHPFFLSNTALFYKTGSTGINIEPDPDLFKLFPIHRKRDINLNIGIAEKAGFSDFYIISASTLNTFSKKEAENYKNEGEYKVVDVKKIPVNTISNIISEKCDGKFPQFLNVDAEGMDEIIVQSIDFEKNHPLVICIETASFSNSGNNIKNHDLINTLVNNGYLMYADTFLNSIFVKKDLIVKKIE